MKINKTLWVFSNDFVYKKVIYNKSAEVKPGNPNMQKPNIDLNEAHCRS